MKKVTALFLAALMVLTLLSACGSKQSSSFGYASETMAVEAPAAMDMMAEERGTGALETNEDAGAGSLPQNRKWIVTVRMDAETEDLDTLLVQLEQQIAGLKGYVEDQELYNGSTYSSRRRRSASLTIRIPAEDVELFTQEVAGIANVISRNLSREDITLTYVATESKVTALKTEETRLLELLAQAENMSDLLEIEARLSQVRYELERHSSQLRLYDNQVDYATIYLSVSEVQEYTPVVERTVGERIRDGFVSSLDGVKEGVVDFVVWVLSNSPYLVVWAIVLTAAWFATRKLRRRCKEKRAAKKAAKSEKESE